MKKVRVILFAATLATLGLFSMTVLSSCHKKKVCPVGLTGSECIDQVRTTYTGTYAGDGTDNNGNKYSNWKFQFSPSGTDVTKMTLVISNGSMAPVTLGVTLKDNFSFTIDPNATQTNAYSGNGTITSTGAGLNLTHVSTPPGGQSTTVIYNFPNLAKQ